MYILERKSVNSPTTLWAVMLTDEEENQQTKTNTLSFSTRNYAVSKYSIV